MTIDIHFSCATMEELREAMQRFLGKEHPQVTIDPLIIAVTSEEPEAPATTEEPVATAVASKEETLEALHKLRREKGSDAVKALLNRHGAASFPKLDPGEYAKVLEEARQ